MFSHYVPSVDRVAVLDRAGLSRDELVDLLAGLQRQRAWLDSEEQQVLAALHAAPPEVWESDPPNSERRWIREEVGCALRISSWSAALRMDTAAAAVTRLPGMVALLAAGEVTMVHLRILVEAVDKLDDAHAALVEARVLGRAPAQTPAEFRQSVLKTVMTVNPASVEEEWERAREDRRVTFRPGPNGMTAQYADLPAEDAAVLKQVIDGMASVQLPGDERSIDQRRADALTHLALDRLNGTISDPLPTRHGRKPAIGISIALSTLLGLDEQPADLAGHGPIPASLARRIAADTTGTWRRLVTDPCGRLLDYGTSTYRPPTYRPPQDLTDFVIARDGVCRAPGCRRQASNCDLDHLTPFSHGGTTSADNLLAECRRHHLGKHQTPWHVTGDPNGQITWTDPAGRQYTTNPFEYPIDRTLHPPGDEEEPEPDTEQPESDDETESDPPPF